MANVVLRFALNKISAFLSEQGALLGGLGQEIQLIGDEFGHIKAFLEKVEDFNQEKDDPQLTEWIRQVREVSYDTEDVLDEFAFFFGRTRHRPGFLGSIRWGFVSTKSLPVRHQLATKLQSIKARVKNISEARLRYETSYGSTSTVAQVPGRDAWSHSKDDAALLVEEDELVGIEVPKQHLISQLLEDADSQFKAIAVVGMGGLGKTTLVRKVFDDAAVRSHFQICAWVSVSKNCDYHHILKGLIQELLSQFNEPIPPLMDSMNVYQLKAFLKNFLRGGRYVIVFDDIWDVGFWSDSTKNILPKNTYSGNRVIFTTRNYYVANSCTEESQDYVYEMGCLSFQDSWALFCNKVFKDGQCPEHLKSVAESMVAKCEGLPLAILAIGGLLASKDTSRINDWELVQSRLRGEFEQIGELDRVKRILSLSYNDLPSTHKACLLYTNIYFQGYEISSQHLVRLLVAEGFVEERNGQTAEEIAWECLKDLANRSLIQFHQVLYAGLHDWIHIHDLLREFIATKSRVQNMTTIITTTRQIRRGWPPEKVRRLVFDRYLLQITSPGIDHYVKNCRSIIAFGEKKLVSKQVLAQLLSSNLLTVLELRGIDLKEIPKKVFELFQLRYLGISGKGIRKIPKSIKRLQNLQCFILRGTNVKELPTEIEKLHKLAHLLFEEQAVDSPEGQLAYDGFITSCRIGELLELQTLWAIDAGKSRVVKEIGKLTKLRKLCITNLRREDGKELCSSFENLNNLQELVVASSILDLNHPVSVSSLQSLCSIGLYGPLEEMPAWIKNLQELEKITMSLSNLEDDPLETLQHLPNLFEVRLTGTCQREILCFKAGGFLKLKKLALKNMKLLRWVTIENGAMPSIDQLTMRGLPLPEELPSGIQHLRQLQRLDLLGMSSLLVNKLIDTNDEEEESEDYKRILHVPQVTIGFLSHGRWKLYPLHRNKETVKPTLDIGYESDESIKVEASGAYPSRFTGWDSDDPYAGTASIEPRKTSMGTFIWDTSSKPNYS